MSKVVTIVYNGIADRLKTVAPSGNAYEFPRGEPVSMPEEDAEAFLSVVTRRAYSFERVAGEVATQEEFDFEEPDVDDEPVDDSEEDDEDDIVFLSEDDKE